MKDWQERWKGTVAVSVSENPDLPALGLSDGHLHDAIETIASELLAFGYRLAYGGDLRPGGFTLQLFEFATRCDRTQQSNGQLAVVDYLAWPVHVRMDTAAKTALTEELNGVAEVVWLSPDGTPLRPEQCDAPLDGDPTAAGWEEPLTAMRKTMLRHTSARLVLGGRVWDYRGAMPGVAEETYLALDAGQPVYLLGGFGGCARDIAESMDLVEPWQAFREWEGRTWFADKNESTLNNGLTSDENRRLARTPHIDEAVLLALTGLERIHSTSAKQS